MSSPNKSNGLFSKNSPKKMTVALNTQSYAAEIEKREQLYEKNVENCHNTTTSYIIAQHKAVVDDLRRDNAQLR